MSARLVTGYVPVPNHPRKEIEFEVWAKALRRVLAPLTEYRLNVEECWLHPEFEALRSSARGISHAVDDNPTKNTPGYHIAMHQKLFWLLQAAEEHPQDETLIWVDFGIFHVPGVLPGHVEELYRHVLADPPNEVTIPGCWSPPLAPHQVVGERPCWRFCGGVMIVPRSRAWSFYDNFREVTLRYLRQTRLLTWEVNDLARMEVEYAATSPIRWYRANHDASMFTGYAEARASQVKEGGNHVR